MTATPKSLNWHRRPEGSAWKPAMAPKDPHLIEPIGYIGLGNPQLRILPVDVHQKVRLIMVRSTEAEVEEVMETPHEKKSRNLWQTEKNHKHRQIDFHGKLLKVWGLVLATADAEVVVTVLLIPEGDPHPPIQNKTWTGDLHLT